MAEYKGAVSVLPDRKIVRPAYAAGEHTERLTCMFFVDSLSWVAGSGTPPDVPCRGGGGAEIFSAVGFLN